MTTLERAVPEPRPEREGSPPRTLGFGGHSSSFGERGISKRLHALSTLTPLEDGRLLDVGCADGSYTMRLAASFNAVDAIDVEPVRLEAFRAAVAGTTLAGKVRIAEMSAERLDFPDCTFDVVTTIEVLEHVTGLERAISEIQRVLKPNGRFLITSPNRYFPFETHGFLVKGQRYPPLYGPFLPWLVPLHSRLADARSFTVRGLTPVIERHGFDRIGYTYIMPPFDRPGIGRHLRPILDTIERSPLKFFGMALVLAFRKVSSST
jgi:ubiquinone/menaquinone biosynthesis C-methylase UbiE